MVIEISGKEIKQYKKLEVISQLTMVREKIQLIKQKYNSSLDEFEKTLGDKEENFEKWDDFIEWTAYVETEKNLINKLEEIANAKDISITRD